MEQTNEELVKFMSEYPKDMFLSELQDKYHKRLTDKGYDLERGIKHSDNEHVKIKDKEERIIKK